MEDKRIVTQILKFAATIDLFETNIRYLGGLLAGKQPIALVPRSVC
jgi:hypothetical protein